MHYVMIEEIVEARHQFSHDSSRFFFSESAAWSRLLEQIQITTATKLHEEVEVRVSFIVLPQANHMLTPYQREILDLIYY